MPLPQNSPLALLGYSRPGDPVQSKPKQAMLVRLSSETLDALEAYPTQNQIQFEFGNKPGIFVGDTYFPMHQYPREDENRSPHELYLRASSASKKAAPLKLYATVVGKFAVERELTNELRDKIQESTQDAAAQRNIRTTILIDTPPDLPAANSKKRKEPPSSSSLFRKPLRAADKPKGTPAVSTAAPTNRVPPPPAASTSQSREGGVPLRKRVVQCLAAGEKSEDQLVKLVGGSGASVTLRREVQDLLEQLAEPTIKVSSSDKSPKIYRLKPKSWTEVRPYEWPMMNENERTAMARAARVAFQNLHIPESDPVWNHVRYRSPGSMNTSTSQHASSTDHSRAPNSTDAPPKRGVSSRDAKEKNKKPRPDPKAEIMMKDESIKATRVNPSPRNESVRANPSQERRRETTQMNPPPEVRRSDSSQSRRPNDSPRNNESATVRRQPALETKTAKRSVLPEDAYPTTSKRPRDGDRESAGSSSVAKIYSAHQADDKSLAAPRVAKIRRENVAGGASDSERERERNNRGSVNVDRQKMKEKEKMTRREDSPREDVRGSATKRKVVDRGDDDFQDSKARALAQKRRKTEPVQLPSSSVLVKEREREREREERIKEREDRLKDGSPLKKSYVEPRPVDKSVPRHQPSVVSSVKTKTSGRQQESPAPPVKRKISNNANSASAASPSSLSAQSSNQHSSRSSTTTKVRRRSPIYTSSEEEEEEETPLSTRNGLSKNALIISGNAASIASTSASHVARDSRDKVTSSRKPLPTDHTALRARYSTSYLEYLTSFQQLVRQKGKIDSMLKNNDLGGADSVTDSEGDIELMDADELAQLTSSHRQLHDELLSIQQVFGGHTSRNAEPLPPAPELLTV